MALDIDAKSVLIGGGAVFAATQLFGGSKKSGGVSGLGKPASKRKKSSSTGTKRKASGTKKTGTTKRKTTKRK